MPINTVFFDLDGTLLPMDQEEFAKEYFRLLAARTVTLGYEPNALIGGIFAGVKAMIKNDGSRTNEAAFWDTFSGIFGPRVLADKPAFDAFYRDEFPKLRSLCGFTPKAAEIIRSLLDAGAETVLATNPVFPAVATEHRIRWAGLSPEDFRLYTTYENTRFCKPSLDYYREILTLLGRRPEECLMVGNDVADDMAAKALGMRVFLLTDCLINKAGEDISVYPNGDFDQLAEWIKNNM